MYKWIGADITDGLLRNYVSAIFDYYGIGYNGKIDPSRWDDAANNKSWQSRSVVIVGSGLLYKRKISKKGSKNLIFI